jgi:purine-binding chemotaxis protein CheW
LEVSDPVDLEVDSRPPAPAPEWPPETAVLGGFLNELISDPLLDPYHDAAGAQFSEPAGVELIEEPSVDRAEVVLPEPFPESGLAIDPGTSLPAVVEVVDESVGSQPVLPESDTAEPIAAGPFSELNADRQAALAYAAAEPEVNASTVLPAVESAAALETAETVTVAETEVEPTSAEQPSSTALDGLVAEIDELTEEAFRGEQEFVFESEGAVKEARGRDSCIVFLLAGTRYAIPMRNVVEIDTLPRTTLVPNVPSFVLGVTNVRGEIISVLDLRSLFGMERWESAERGRILIVRTTDQQTAALAVDEVRGTASLPLDALGAPTAPIHDKVMPLLLGVGEYQDHVLNVLDVDKMFRTREIQQFSAN